MKFKFAIPCQILKVRHAVRRWWGRRPHKLRLGTGCLGIKAILNHLVEEPPALFIQPSSLLRLHANFLGLGDGPGEAVDSFLNERGRSLVISAHKSTPSL